MLDKVKNFFNVLSLGLIIFIITSNMVYAEPVKDGAAGPHSPMGQIIMMVVLFACVYFLMLRPQKNKAKEHQSLLANLAIGDEVVTMGGILGKIEKVLDHFIIIRVASGVEVTMQKQAVVQILPKNTIESL